MADEIQDMAEVQKIFKRFDINGDGKISSTELRAVLKELGCAGDVEIESMMAKVDTDGDGFISFQEFTDFHKANIGLMKDIAGII